MGWPGRVAPQSGLSVGPRIGPAFLRQGDTIAANSGTEGFINRSPYSVWNLPALATPQLPPFQSVPRVPWPAVAPPVRAAEPYTVESWVMVLNPVQQQ